MKIILRNLVDRLKESLGLKTDTEIAEMLDIPQNTFSGQISRNSLKFENFEKLHKIMFENNLSINWIIYGIKEDVSSKNSILNYEKELIENIKKLSIKRQEYYYHRIKADIIHDENFYEE